MIDVHTIGLTPARMRFALGYACTCAWAVVLLLSPAFGAPDDVHATSASMLPGLVACLGSLFFSRKFPSIAGRTPFVAAAALLMAVGTLLCTYPPAATITEIRIAGLVLSGFFAIILIMSWFDAYARLNPRAIIVLAGCAVSIAAAFCWIILTCPAHIASILTTLLPFVSLATLPPAREAKRGSRDEASAVEKSSEAKPTAENPSFLDVMAAAVPMRTLVGLAITFFIVSSIGSLAPEFDLFGNAVTPLSLLVPLGITAFFVGSALFVHHQIDPSILYKILLSAFAAAVFLLMLSVGVSASLVLYANISADVMMWMVLALWAKKTPVKPHLVFAIGWIAECAGNTLGQLLAPLFAAQIQVFYVVAIMLILVAVGFAFSEGSLVLDIDFQDDEDGLQVRTDDEANATHTKGASAQGYDVLSTAKRQNGGDIDPLDSFATSHDLSPREREVFGLWITGHGLKYIENALFISESTVKSHLRSIYRKCDTHNRAEIIDLFEQENGLAG